MALLDGGLDAYAALLGCLCCAQDIITKLCCLFELILALIQCIHLLIMINSTALAIHTLCFVFLDLR